MPVFFFFNDTATTEIYTLSLHDALPISVSVTPAGAVTVAVLTRFPVADDFTVTETVKVAVPPASRLTEAEMSPEPEAGQDDPEEATHVQLTPDSFDEKLSATEAPVTSEGPLLLTTIV